MMAIGLVVLAMLIGSGVDMGRAYKAQRRLQAACDAGVLAGRRAVTTQGFDATATAQARAYFNANFDDEDQQTRDTDFIPTSEDTGNTIIATAMTSLDTVLMRIAGFDDFDLSVSCSASMGVGNSDIMFVLDNTGSMNWTADGDTSPDEGEESRLTSLKNSMQNFYTTVAASVEGSNARIRYGFVPYSTSVNVGHLLDPDWIANSITVPSRQPVNWGPVNGTWEGSDYTSVVYTSWQNAYGPYNTATACNNSLATHPNEASYTNVGSTTTSTTTTIGPTARELITATGTHQPQQKAEFRCNGSGSKRYVQRRYATRESRSFNYQSQPAIPVTAHNATFSDISYEQRTFDTSVFKTYNSSTKKYTSVTIPFGTSGSTLKNTNYTWKGCIEERATVSDASFSFTSLATGITPSGATDLDIDTKPTSDATKWKPYWPEVNYYRSWNTAYSDVGGHGSGKCPAAAKLLGAMTEAEFNAYTGALVADGSTYHDIGLIWGARLASPNGIFADNVTDEPDNGATVSRHLIFMTDGELAPTLTVHSAWGIERNDKRVTGTGNNDPEQYNRHRARYLAVCEAIKARGIRLWVIAFGSGVELSEDLLTCASDRSASAFKADNAEELDKHFQEIAKKVGELRVVQ